MVNIDERQLRDLSKISSGNFGNIYRAGDNVFKVYEPKIKTTVGTLDNNPMLRDSYKVISRLQKLIELNKKVKKTDLITDLLYVDGKFRGVVLPYYDGLELTKVMDKPLKDKIEYSRKLLENARELSKHHIYPTDYKLINLLLVGNQIKIIDLDDIFTKVGIRYAPMYHKECIYGLYETIAALLNENRYHCYISEADGLTVPHKSKIDGTFESIESYLDDKEEDHSYIFLDETTDLDIYSDALYLNDIRVVVLNHGDKETLLRLLDELNRRHIRVYDVIDAKVLYQYLNDSSYSDCLILHR